MYSTIKPYIDISRVSNLPTVWTNVLTAAMLAGPGPRWPAVVLLMLSMSLFYATGMCLNDILDVDVDRDRRPDRPIPSGRITLRQAWLFAAALYSGALMLLFLVPFRRALIAAAVLTALIIWYDLYHKRYSLSILAMAACRLMVFIATALAMSGRIGFAVLLAASIQFGYTICISAVARYENRNAEPFSYPIIPWMIAGISLVDGLIMASMVSPEWLFAGASGAVLTIFGQRYARGD
jgi:4-hydroxybenzoate polyprenyltransferase